MTLDTNITRRRFLQGVAALAAVVVLPKLPLPELGPTVPILYGDGVHDDSPGLQALINGEPVDKRDNASRMLPDGTLYISAGTYLIGETVRLRRLNIQGSYFKRVPNSEGPFLYVETVDE